MFLEIESPKRINRFSCKMKQLPIPEISCSNRAGGWDEQELQKYKLFASKSSGFRKEPIDSWMESHTGSLKIYTDLPEY